MGTNISHHPLESGEKKSTNTNVIIERQQARECGRDKERDGDAVRTLHVYSVMNSKTHST